MLPVSRPCGDEGPSASRAGAQPGAVFPSIHELKDRYISVYEEYNRAPAGPGRRLRICYDARYIGAAQPGRFRRHEASQQRQAGQSRMEGRSFPGRVGFLIPGVREAPLVKVRPAIHAASGNSGTVQKAGHLAAGEAGLKASCSIRSKALVRRPGQRSAPQ